MKAADMERLGCPWLQPYSLAAYASAAVTQLIGGSEGFGSKDVRHLFRARGGFALRLAEQGSFHLPASEDSRFAAALLSKLSQRGLPAPCSLHTERAILAEAQAADVLRFKERQDAGEFQFLCEPKLPNLDLMIKACCVPALMVDEQEVNRLLSRYQPLCTDTEAEFLQELIAYLPNTHLALLFLPQRQLGSMVTISGDSPVTGADRVDFSLEVPILDTGAWLRVAIEVDDGTHSDAQTHQDGERAEALSREGWAVERFLLEERTSWPAKFRRLAGELDKAIPEEVLKAASQLRALPARQKAAVQALVCVPVAEAQLGAALALALHRTGQLDLSISDPQGIGIATAVESIRETIESLVLLHGMEGVGQPEVAGKGVALPDIIYYGLPSAAAWDDIIAATATVITPSPVHPRYVEPLLPAKPRPVEIGPPDPLQRVRAALHYLLQNVFRKVDFRPGQMEIVERALALRPVIGLLPTAAGKSLCYQLASLAQPGFTLVVDPLRSLMLDQQENLETMGIHRSLAVMSGVEGTEVEDRRFREEGYHSIEAGHQLFVFVAPERLQMPDFRDHVKGFCAGTPIPYCIIDEAHCVSEWGHDFRPSYLNVGRLVQTYCDFEGTHPSLLALTGTASRNVLLDIMRELQIEDQEAIVEPRSFDRKELEFEVYQVPSCDRMPQVAGKLRSVLLEFGWRAGQPGRIPSGLVFTHFVNDREIGVSKLAGELRSRVGIPIEVYSGSMPWQERAGSDLAWEQRKAAIQRRFKRDETPILACTQAFGMGIDKPGIRFTIHTMLPRSLEEFYQQAGRAGRDQGQSRCIIIFVDDQPALADNVLNPNLTLEGIDTRRSQVPRHSQGDAIRNTWFLTQSFVGRDLEKKILRYVLSEILLPKLTVGSGDKVSCEVPFGALPDHLLQRGDSKKKVEYDDKVLALEKALYRLLLVGAIADYMKDYTRRKFRVDVAGKEPRDIYASLERYLRRYVPEGEATSLLPGGGATMYFEAAFRCTSALIDFIYEHVEKRRRRAIYQMLQTARDAVQLGPKSFREQLLAYLEESEFTQPVLEMAYRMEPDDWFEILSKVRGIDDITKLLGACRRQLEESPSHPGLLLIAGLCRLASPNPQQGQLDLRAGLSALRQTLQSWAQRARVVERLILQTRRIIPSRLDALLGAMLDADPSVSMARLVYQHSGEDSEEHLRSVILLATGVLGIIRQKEGAA